MLNAAELFDDDASYSLAQLGRAIAFAPRRDITPIWRAFVRTSGRRFVREVRTQKIRVRFGAGTITRAVLR
jgi:hypothetical protein